MSLGIGFGYVCEHDDSVIFKFSDPIQSAVYAYDTFTELTDLMRKRYGCIDITVEESYRSHKFAFTIYEKPF
jgi:hypothetical protein